MRHVARQSKILPRRPAFTLVELLVVMGVLAMMSSLVLVGLASAAEQARVSRTRSQVQKIHELLMTRWEDYRYRRVEPMNSTDDVASLKYVQIRQRYRVDRIRELMRMEMPCRIEDVQFDSTIKPPASTSSLLLKYRRNVVTRAGGMSNWTTSFEDSECLYMILESIQDGDTNGLDFFKESEIGDTDGDGMPEVLDAWGTPIRFIRWAPGFRGARSNLHRQDAPDPFDPLGMRGGKSTGTSGEFLHFPLYPLVISAGPDQALDLLIRYSETEVMDATVQPSTDYPVPNNPYFTNKADGSQFGMETDANSNSTDEYLDNISNHQLVIGGN